MRYMKLPDFPQARTICQFVTLLAPTLSHQLTTTTSDVETNTITDDKVVTFTRSKNVIAITGLPFLFGQ